MKIEHFAAVILAVAIGTCGAIAQTLPQANLKVLEALKKNDTQGAIGILDSDISKGKNLFESYKLRAQLKDSIGNAAGAFADFSKALEIQPAEGELYRRRAEIRMELHQDTSLIITDLNSAISYGVKHEKVYVTRGIIRIDSGDIDNGIADLRLAIGLRPDYALATVRLASAYRKKGDEDSAVKTLEDFVASIEAEDKKIRPVSGTVFASNTVFSPELVDSTPPRENTSLLVGQPVTLKSIPTSQDLERMGDKMEQTKNTATAYSNLASLYEKRKELDKGLLTADKGLKIDPNDFYGLGIRGIIKLDQADYIGAVSDFDSAIKITPKNASLYLNRGIAYLLLNKPIESQRDFDKYLELNPNGKAFLEKQIEYAKTLQNK